MTQFSRQWMLFCEMMPITYELFAISATFPALRDWLSATLWLHCKRSGPR
jgi:hypothetical protein